MMIPKVTRVQALADHQIELWFSDGQHRVFNMEPYLDCGVFRELQRPEVFKSVRVSFDTIQWANGADLCPEVLYDHSVPAESDLVASSTESDRSKT